MKGAGEPYEPLLPTRKRGFFQGKRVFGFLEKAARSFSPPISPVCMPTLSDVFELHRQGALADAETGYRTLLEQDPRNAQALHFLGVLATQTNRPAWGVELIRQALAVDEHQADAWTHLAVAYRRLQQPESALSCCEQALRLDPQHADAYNTQGNVLRDLSRDDEAICSFTEALRYRPQFLEAALSLASLLFSRERYQEAIHVYRQLYEHFPQHPDVRRNLAIAYCQRSAQLNTQNCAEAAAENARQALLIEPTLAEAHGELGRALYELGQHPAALACFQAGLSLAPDNPSFHNNLGNGLTRLNRLPEAEAHYRQAIALAPNIPDYYSNLGTVLRELRRYEEALAHCNQALTLAPDFAQAWNNRAIALYELRRYDEALVSIDRALTLRDPYPEAHNNRGNVYRDLGQLEPALASYDQALQLRPSYAYAWFNRGNTLFNLQRYAEAAQAFAEALKIEPTLAHALGNQAYAERRICDWRQTLERTSTLREAVRAGQAVDTPLAFLSVSDDPAEQRQCAEDFVRLRYPVVSANPVPRQTAHVSHDKLRIAYLSADLREHAVAYLMTGVFEQHDRSRFEVIALAWGAHEVGPTAERVRAAFDRWIDIATFSDTQVAALISELEIDVLIDLMGHTAHARTGIFSARPAPIQVNYLGYPGTMGASYIDYLIADAYLIPGTQRAHYVEKIVYLPECFQANDDQRHRPEATERAILGLPGDGVVFCSFNTSNKLNPTLFASWMRILEAVPNSVLWLLAESPIVEANLKQAATSAGVSSQRLRFAPKCLYAQHLDRLAAADLFLDSLPFNAGTTASDALWAGVPVLTCSGQSFAGRMAGSLLTTLGLPVLITANLADYEAQAIHLATSPGTLTALRTRLIEQRQSSPLFDTGRFTRYLEAAYIQMIERHRQGLAPADIAIDPL